MSAQELLLKMGGGIKFRQGTHLPNLIPTTIFLAIRQTGVTTRMHMHTIAQATVPRVTITVVSERRPTMVCPPTPNFALISCSYLNLLESAHLVQALQIGKFHCLTSLWMVNWFTHTTKYRLHSRRCLYVVHHVPH